MKVPVFHYEKGRLELAETLDFPNPEEEPAEFLLFLKTLREKGLEVHSYLPDLDENDRKTFALVAHADCLPKAEGRLEVLSLHANGRPVVSQLYAVDDEGRVHFGKPLRLNKELLKAHLNDVRKLLEQTELAKLPANPDEGIETYADYWLVENGIAPHPKEVLKQKVAETFNTMAGILTRPDVAARFRRELLEAYPQIRHITDWEFDHENHYLFAGVVVNEGVSAEFAAMLTKVKNGEVLSYCTASGTFGEPIEIKNGRIRVVCDFEEPSDEYDYEPPEHLLYIGSLFKAPPKLAAALETELRENPPVGYRIVQEIVESLAKEEEKKRARAAVEDDNDLEF